MKSTHVIRRLAVAFAFIRLFSGIPEGALGQQTTDKVVLLDQGWSQEERLQYYFTSQGSAVMPYDLFLNLEQAKSEELFRSNKNYVSFGFVVQEPDPKYNVDGLPIGVTKTTVREGRFRGEWVGLTCAACHNTQLNYKGTKVRVDGGANNSLDMDAYIVALNDALAATVADGAKFERLARRMNRTDAAGKEELRKRLEVSAREVNLYVTRALVSAVPAGPSRTDALTKIHNEALGLMNGVPENTRVSLAPTKPPFLWNAPQSSWVQWSAVAADPINRNFGEALGVYGRVNLEAKTPEEGRFGTTIDIKGQIEIENLLRRLAPPKWPEEVLGKIDQQKAAAGKQLFVENCAACHSVWPHRWSEPKLEGKRFIENALVPLSVVGTDPMQFDTPIFDKRPVYLTGRLRNDLPPPDRGAVVASQDVLMRTLMRGAQEPALAKLGLSEEQIRDARGYRSAAEPGPTQPVYKAGPRDGVWATPPFLHNGSVPSLYDLLTPAKDRPKKFYVGSEFDPVRVGLDTSGNSGSFLFDTTLAGNSNAGHSFEDGPRGNGVIGRLLTDDERWALVEYLKSIPTEPAQVTPYGGPKDPIRAWQDPTFFHVKTNTGYDGSYKSEAPAPRDQPAGKAALGEETIPPDEAEKTQAIVTASLDMVKSLHPDGKGLYQRDAHAKAYGVVRAEFIVLDDLPADLRYGVFAKPRTYDALIRFSASSHRSEPDTVIQPHGMAIKLLEVEGEKLLESEKTAKTQDFVMINHPTFFVADLGLYEETVRATTMGTSALSQFFSEHPALQAVAQKMANKPFYNPLQVRYWSEVPYRLGPHAIKFSAAPLTDQSNAKPERTGPEYLRDAMIATIGHEDFYFAFLVQMQTDPVKMPIEDPVTEWLEADSPFRRVALIRIPKQDISSPENLKIAEDLSFTPWHALPEHRPLGGINRVRRSAYEAISEYRHRMNGTQSEEPTELPKW